MFRDTLLAVLLTPLLLILWTGVQRARRRLFASKGGDRDGDEHADRKHCGPCGCRLPGQPGQDSESFYAQEDRS